MESVKGLGTYSHRGVQMWKPEHNLQACLSPFITEGGVGEWVLDLNSGRQAW